MKKFLFVALILAAVFTAGCVTSPQIPPGCSGLQTDEECAASLSTTPTPTEPALVVKSEQVQATPMPTESMAVTAKQTVNSGTETMSGSITSWQSVSDTGKTFTTNINGYNLKIVIAVGSTRSWLMWWILNTQDTVNGKKLFVKVSFRDTQTGQTATDSSFLEEGCIPGVGCELKPLKELMPDASPENIQWQAEFQIKEQ